LDHPQPWPVVTLPGVRAHVRAVSDLDGLDRVVGVVDGFLEGRECREKESLPSALRMQTSTVVTANPLFALPARQGGSWARPF
jgi:hypothetical protein